MSLEYCHYKNKTHREVKQHLNSCLENLALEISNGLDSYAEYKNMKKEAAEEFDRQCQHVLTKGRVGGQLEGEAASIANVIQERKRIDAKVITELENKNGEVEEDEVKKEKIVFDHFSEIYKLEIKPPPPSTYLMEPINKLNLNEKKTINRKLKNK